MKEPPKGVWLNRAILRQQDGPNVKSNPGGAFFHGRAERARVDGQPRKRGETLH